MIKESYTHNKKAFIPGEQSFNNVLFQSILHESIRLFHALWFKVTLLLATSPSKTLQSYTLWIHFTHNTHWSSLANNKYHVTFHIIGGNNQVTKCFRVFLNWKHFYTALIVSYVDLFLLGRQRLAPVKFLSYSSETRMFCIFNSSVTNDYTISFSCLYTHVYTSTLTQHH